MRKEELLEAIGDIDDIFLQEAWPAQRSSVRPLWKKIGVLAACLSMVAMLSVPFFVRQMNDAVESVNDIDYYSQNSKPQTKNEAIVTEISPDKMQDQTEIFGEYCLVPLTEQELFALPTDIFYGEILGERYYLVDFGCLKSYYKVSQIRVDTVYRGDVEAGDIVSVRTSAGTEKGIYVSASGTVLEMEKGVTGIFMLNDFEGEVIGDTVFDGAGVVTHYFMDGERFAFLETAEGLVFSKTAYPAIKNAKTLHTIEIYVKLMSWRFGE